jgi:hypothetical protein
MATRASSDRYGFTADSDILKGIIAVLIRVFLIKV